MASGFVLGLGLVAVLERLGPLAGASERAAALHGPASMLPRLIPVWVVVTVFLVRSEILRAYELRFSVLKATGSAGDAAADTELDHWIELESTRCCIGDLARVSAEENYCRIFHIADDGIRSFLIRSTLHELLDRLPSSAFLQIHRSHAVNREFVQRVQRKGRRFFVVLSGMPDWVPISRGRLDGAVAALADDGASSPPVASGTARWR